jgi:hypothetical protein
VIRWSCDSFGGVMGGLILTTYYAIVSKYNRAGRAA